MPTVCKITLDAEQYRQELSRVVEETRAAVSSMNMGSSASTPEVPQVEDQEYTITGVVNAPEIPEVEDQEYTITGVVNAPEIPEAEDQTYTVRGDIDIPDAASDALGDIADNAADAASEVGKAGGKIGFFTGLLNKLRGVGAGEQIGKGAAAVGALGAAAGASVPPVGALAAVVNALLSPIALITMAITALAAIGTAVFDALTVSSEEYAAQAEHAAEESEREADKLKKQAEAAQQCVDRLKELSSVEAASNTTKAETLSLLNSLQKEYGNLGAQIDRTTGRILNLTEVEKKLRRVRAGKEADNAEQQAEAKIRQARASYMKGLGDSYRWTEAGAGKNFDQYLSSNNNDLEGMLRDIRGVYAWAEREGHSAETLKGISESIGYLEEALELEKRSGSLRDSGFGSDAEAREAVTDARRKTAEAMQKYRSAHYASRVKAWNDAFEESDDYEYKRNNRQQWLDSQMVGYRKLVREKKRLEEQRNKIAWKYSAGQEYSPEDAIAYAQLEEQLLEVCTSIVKSQEQQASLRKQIQTLDRQHSEELEKQATAKRNYLGNLAHEYDYDLLIAQGMFDKAAALKLERELREKNLKLTQDEKAVLEDTLIAQAELNLQNSLFKKATDLKYQVMEQSGRGYEAAQARAIQEAQAAKGRSLDDTETEWIKRLTDLTFQLKNVQGPRLGDLSIKTNALASRGGFQGSVRMPSSARYNRIISEHTRQLVTTVQKIENLCRQLGVF